MISRASLLTMLAVLIGAAGGFAYYRFVGCSTGTCPITSNPYISTGYGALLGLVLAGGKKKTDKT
jgi:hypothetical protein